MRKTKDPYSQVFYTSHRNSTILFSRHHSTSDMLKALITFDITYATNFYFESSNRAPYKNELDKEISSAQVDINVYTRRWVKRSFSFLNLDYFSLNNFLPRKASKFDEILKAVAGLVLTLSSIASSTFLFFAADKLENPQQMKNQAIGFGITLVGMWSLVAYQGIIRLIGLSKIKTKLEEAIQKIFNNHKEKEECFLKDTEVKLGNSYVDLGYSQDPILRMNQILTEQHFLANLRLRAEISAEGLYDHLLDELERMDFQKRFTPRIRDLQDPTKKRLFIDRISNVERFHEFEHFYLRISYFFQGLQPDISAINLCISQVLRAMEKAIRDE